MKKNYIAIAAILPLLLFYSSSIFSQALYEVSLDEKVAHSSLIIEGTVVGKTSFWNAAHTLIFTSNKIKLHKLFKGETTETELELLTQGGSVGTDYLEVSDLADLSVGETGIFFCYPNVLGLRSPASNSVLWDIYSSAQGFIRYDLTTKIADAPFVKYQDITSKLYPAITQKTGKAFQVKDPFFDAGVNIAPQGPANVMGISSFSPTTVVAGATASPSTNLLTINGTNFGNPAATAAILFDDANNGTGGTAFTVAYNDPLVVSWTNTQIQVRVPSRAGTGLFDVRDELGNMTNSGSALNVSYSVLTAAFTGYTAQNNLMNTNGLGGYTILYSTSTAGSGVNLNSSATKTTFQRALNTWKEISGFNITEGGTTTAQAVNPSDNQNVIMFDNTNTGNPPLASGVLATCYSFASTCTPLGTTAVRKTEFDIVIRNNAVSTGSTAFDNGPCYPVSAIDMETVVLHELGHAINLGHINDNFEFAGGGYPNINPGKLMHYAVLTDVARKSPDWSSFTGAQYCIGIKGLIYGSCASANTEMSPLTTIAESKDECPTFPSTPTAANTFLHFDLEHATSNKNTDPQYTAISCTGLGTSITNTAFYALKTGTVTGPLTLSVSNYSTSPAGQQLCSNAGVEMAIYQVSSCPLGQAYPAPFACLNFNANGILPDINGLAANTTYLMVFDGLNATKANFDLFMNGAALPVRITDFTGNAKDYYNELKWNFTLTPDVKTIYLEAGTDGIHFTPVFTKATGNVAGQTEDLFHDFTLSAKRYYRLKLVSADGKVEYSSILLLRRDLSKNSIVVSPNPATEYVNISLNRQSAASVTVSLLDATGKTLQVKHSMVAAGNQTIQLTDLGKLASGTYLVRIWDGEKTTSQKLLIK